MGFSTNALSRPPRHVRVGGGRVTVDTGHEGTGGRAVDRVVIECGSHVARLYNLSDCIILTQ
jgi:hypothetical protein